MRPTAWRTALHSLLLGEIAGSKQSGIAIANLRWHVSAPQDTGRGLCTIQLLVRDRRLVNISGRVEFMHLGLHACRLLKVYFGPFLQCETTNRTRCTCRSMSIRCSPNFFFFSRGAFRRRGKRRTSMLVLLLNVVHAGIGLWIPFQTPIPAAAFGASEGDRVESIHSDPPCMSQLYLPPFPGGRRPGNALSAGQNPSGGQPLLPPYSQASELPKAPHNALHMQPVFWGLTTSPRNALEKGAGGDPQASLD
ncbi:hypothetical protein FN846DRAFT_947157 [Sphaerosporella brunnea]|uniref:Uncharacterized protein n=1 Tax=Sphaerosporella brunnea TaxID=1250544 RepID=A0A5J5EZ91_9PEZI|nr:hypothetical protein FN846DRAFT_947157 [Sphaerosporella brunnea]